jgi:hypothetical protein
MKKKYRLTEDTEEINGVLLHRIEALKDFSDVEAGKKGGWIEKEDNLSHEGDCWVYDNAQVYGDAQVSGNARLQIGKYDEGKITETPMVIISSLFVVNKCGNGIFIGCKKLTAEEWLGDKGKELAIENDFTEKEINEYKKIIQFITKF